MGGALRALGEGGFREVLELVVILDQAKGAGATRGLGIFLIEKGARKLSKVGHFNNPQFGSKRAGSAKDRPMAAAPGPLPRGALRRRSAEVGVSGKAGPGLRTSPDPPPRPPG